MTPELRAYVAAERAAQGLPPTVTDPAMLERAAAAFRAMPYPPATPRTQRRKTTAGDAA